jgi:hypothetical protein
MFLCSGVSRPVFPQADARSGLRSVMLRPIMLLPLLRQQCQKLYGCSGGIRGESAYILLTLPHRVMRGHTDTIIPVACLTCIRGRSIMPKAETGCAY